MRLLVKVTQRSGRVLKQYINSLIINKTLLYCSTFAALNLRVFFFPLEGLIEAFEQRCS
jgi:hypothetical protein